jgi:hypothetical protein
MSVRKGATGEAWSCPNGRVSWRSLHGAPADIGRFAFYEYHVSRDGSGAWKVRWQRLPERLGDPVPPAVILGTFASHGEAVDACEENARGPLYGRAKEMASRLKGTRSSQEDLHAWIEDALREAADEAARAARREAEPIHRLLAEVLVAVNDYSDEMKERHGRGHMEFGIDAPGHSLAGHARALLAAVGRDPYATDRALLFPEGMRRKTGRGNLPPVENGTVLAADEHRHERGGHVLVRAVESASGHPWLEVFGPVPGGQAAGSGHRVRLVAKECGSWEELKQEFHAYRRGERTIDMARAARARGVEREPERDPFER